jgi:hypothetical protein
VLVTLRLTLANGEERLLAQEVVDADSAPRAILAGLAAPDGRVPLGDRESCRLEEIVNAVVVPPEPQRGPDWTEAGVSLRDEDVAAAMASAADDPAETEETL